MIELSTSCFILRALASYEWLLVHTCYITSIAKVYMDCFFTGYSQKIADDSMLVLASKFIVAICMLHGKSTVIQHSHGTKRVGT